MILDPVYIGKAAPYMLAHIRQGRYIRDGTLVFVHTDGTPDLERALALKGCPCECW
jgi:1-aminocyclopropane-1-carboxylate deaminase/D-cysteine desulfhydrase-like pyridoxal-dependent ACC family enzyme